MKFTVSRCADCSGHGATQSGCDCLGAGFTWSDGRPPTLCPNAAAAAPAFTGRILCTRTEDLCLYCQRASEDIGLAEDIQRTKDWAPG